MARARTRRVPAARRHGVLTRSEPDDPARTDAPQPEHRRGSTILARLRVETRAEHDTIESVLDLTTMSAGIYRRWLEKFLGFFRPIEARFADNAELRPHMPDLEHRSKVPHLEADLLALGNASPGCAALCVALPPLADGASAFGALYVLEGSTLGGQVISRRVAATLGITVDTGGRFFHGYGERTGEMWCTFGMALSAFATSTETEDRIVASAIETFRTLRAWLQEDPERIGLRVEDLGARGDDR